MIVFLDFDGVLHPEIAGGDWFQHLDAFCDLMREHPTVEIVISSSWREYHALTDLRALFPADIAERVIGRTPILPWARWGREREIYQFLRDANRQGESWVALDDIRDFFRDHSHVIFCDPEQGLDEAVLALLAVRLAAPLPPPAAPDDADWLAEDLWRMSQADVEQVVARLEAERHPCRYSLKRWAQAWFSDPADPDYDVQQLRRRYLTECVS